MKRLFSVMLILVLLPIIGSAFCPCAQADSSEQILLRKIPCQHCCPEAHFLPSECKTAVIGKTVALDSRARVEDFRLELVQASLSDFVSYFSKPIELSGREPQLSQSKTYLILQVLRL